MNSCHRDWILNPAYREVQDLIDAGWGDVPQVEIPADWRKRKPPARMITITRAAEQDWMRERQRLKRAKAQSGQKTARSEPIPAHR